MKSEEIIIIFDESHDIACALALELRYRGYLPICLDQVDNVTYGSYRYAILLLDDRLFFNDRICKVLCDCIENSTEIIPVCLSLETRKFPASMPSVFDQLRLVQISVLHTDDMFEKSVDKLIEDRFDDKFKRNRKRDMILTDNGLSLNTLRLINIVKKDDESLDYCIYRVFNCKIRESRYLDWDTLD